MDVIYYMPATGKVYKSSKGINNEIDRSGKGRQVLTCTTYKKSGRITVKNNVYGRGKNKK